MTNIQNTYTVMKEIGKSARACIPFMPWTKKRIIRKVQEEADTLLPIISERTGIPLPPVTVKPLSQRLSDIRYYKNKQNPGSIPFNLGLCIAKPLTMIMEELTAMSYEPASKVGVPTVYTSFGLFHKYEGRISNLNIRRRCLAHELSHHLWFTLAGEQGIKDLNREFLNARNWIEGFATYCEDELFYSLHNNPRTKEHKPDSVYFQGKDLIQRVLKEEGQDILLQLPTRWKEFRHYNEKA